MTAPRRSRGLRTISAIPGPLDPAGPIATPKNHVPFPKGPRNGALRWRGGVGQIESGCRRGIRDVILRKTLSHVPAISGSFM